jgi:quinol monooxygenase YgiN
MSTPVTEVVVLTVKPEVDVDGPAEGLFSIIARQEGFRRLKWGRWEEDPNKVQLMISTPPYRNCIRTSLLTLPDWDDISSHIAFTQSGADYQELFAGLTPLIAAPPEIFHLQIDPDAINKILDDPIVELATFFLVGEGFEEAVTNTLAVNTKSEGCLGFARGPVVEELAYEDGPKGKAHYAAISWTSLEARTATTQREDVKESGQLLIGKIGGYEVHHVKFQ